VTHAYFVLNNESPSRCDYASDPATGGPWRPDLQHGGPPNALLVHAAELAARRETDRTDLVPVRLAAEFVGPVPVADVSTTAGVVRAARSAILVEASLEAAGRTCLTGRVWLVAGADTSAIATSPDPASRPPADYPLMADTGFPYGRTIEWRSIFGGLAEPGPARVWTRPTVPLLAGQQLSGLQRAVLVGDSASGISAELDWAAWSFANIDLDVHLTRPLTGDWLLMDAATHLGPGGYALARSTLSDERALVGATAQTLLVTPRR
jgi:hypothetical protein